MSKTIKQVADEIACSLEEQAIHFTDDMKKEIEGKMQILRDCIQDKKGSIDKYNAFLNHIAECKEELRRFDF